MEDYIIEIIKQIFGNEMVAPVCVCIVAFAVTHLRFSLIDALEPEIVRAIDRIVRLIDDALPEYLPSGKELNQLVEDSCFNVAVPVDVNGAVF